MTNEPKPLETIKAFYGDKTTVSDWFTVEQTLIDKFGEATCDLDWMHVDPERAKREGPFGGTIAFGFWTISMMTCFTRQMFGQDYPEGALYGLNYGFDRLRLMSPVPIGRRIRCHCRLMDIEERGEGQFLVKTENRIEVKGVEKPAMIAEWLFMLVYSVMTDSTTGRD